MAKRIFEFVCNKAHRTEHFVDSETLSVQCPECGDVANRVISAPRISLEGFTGAFPTAADAWARKHEQAARERAKKDGS